MVLGEARQLILHEPKQEEVCRCQVQRIRWVAENLDALVGELILDDGGSVTRGVIPIKKTTPAPPGQACSSSSAS